MRAVLMAAVFLSAKLIYRRMDLLNVAAISALVILAARPSEITDASFLLSFSAVVTIGAIAVPCIARSSEPYRLALDHLSDVTRDVSHAPRVIQFRMEMRAAAAWISARLASLCSALRIRPPGAPFRAAFYFWEIIFISAILQLGMLPPLAYYFHRVTLAGPFANVPALLLTGLAVPIGFLTLAASLVSHALAAWLAKLLGLILAMLDAAVRWFAGWHGASYRIPGPSVPHRNIHCVRARSFRGHSHALECLVAIERRDRIAGQRCHHRDAPFSAASHASTSGIDCARRGPGRQPFSFFPARAHDAGRWGRRTRKFSFGRHALRD